MLQRRPPPCGSLQQGSSKTHAVFHEQQSSPSENPRRIKSLSKQSSMVVRVWGCGGVGVLAAALDTKAEPKFFKVSSLPVSSSYYTGEWRGTQDKCRNQLAEPG